MEKLLASIINNGIENNKNLNDYIINKNTNDKIYLRDYQKLSSSYFLQNNINSFFLYWEPGFGKTLAAIYIMQNLKYIWPNWNYVIMVKSQLINEPWLKNIKIFIPELLNYITFISYDQKILTADDIINKLKTLNKSNRTIFIIDEAHNFIKQVVESENMNDKRLTKKNFFDRFIKIVNYGKNKLLLMTATPIHNSNEELKYFLKLLRPNNFNINDIFFKDDKLIDPNELKLCLYGSVSVQKNNDVDILTNTNPKNDLAGRRIKIHNLLMDDFQSKEYISMYELEKKSKIRGLKPFTRSISTLAIPVLKSNYDNIEDYKQQINLEYNNFLINIMNIKLDDDDIEDFKNGHLEGVTIEIINNLEIKDYKKPKNIDLINKIILLHSYSCKYIKICHNILNTKGKCLLYESLVKFAGIKTLKPYLDLFKISYLEFSGNTLSSRDEFLEEFNSKNNIDGEKIKLLIFSSAGEEGINFTNIKNIIISSIPWSGSKLEQIIGRAIRLNSHYNLPIDERIVDINILIAYTNDKKYSVDYELLTLINKKEISRTDVFNVFNNSSIETIHKNFPYEDIQSDELFINFNNKKYELRKDRYINITKEYRNIYYTLDINFLNINKGLLNNDEVYSEDLILIGTLIKNNNKPIIKIINNNIVYLIESKFNEIKDLNNNFKFIELENNNTLDNRYEFINNFEDIVTEINYTIKFKNNLNIESMQDFGLELE